MIKGDMTLGEMYLKKKMVDFVKAHRDTFGGKGEIYCFFLKKKKLLDFVEGINFF